MAFVASVAAVCSIAFGATIAQAKLSDYTVTGVSPRGTTIDLFDYWANDEGPQSDDHYEDQGINAGHELKFNGGSVTSYNDVINSWALSGNGPRTGIVANTLGSDGYPTLSGKTITGDVKIGDTTRKGTQQLSTDSLAYLFNRQNGNGKKAYTDVKGLLQVDSDGYYYYNASSKAAADAGGSYDSANFASFDEETNSFTLYKTWGVYKEGTYSSDGQFFPFADPDNVINAANGRPTDIKSTNTSLNHHFGLHMSTRFVQQYGGHVDDTQNSKEVTYEFSGDDDVWIFIDDVLVGDLGGIHDAASITINFATGNIEVTASNGQDVTPDGMKTIKACFEAASKSTDGFKGNTFKDDTYHTLDFFYLERGGTDSNMSLKYNLVNIPESGVLKIDQDGTEMSNVEFSLYQANENYSVTAGAAYYTGKTDDNGELVFTTTEGSADDTPVPVTLEQLRQISPYWVLREETQEGYRNPGDIKLRFENGFLLSSNAWETGTYAQAQVTVTAADVLYDTHNNVVTTTEDGFIFAVVHQKQKKDASETWHAVSGNAFDGWVIEDGIEVADAINAAQKDARNNQLNRFTVGSGGALQCDIANLPGDVNTYEYVLKGNGGNADNAEYTIRYYYTTASSIDDANAGNTKMLATDKTDTYAGFDRVYTTTLNISNVKNELSLLKTDNASNTPLSGATYTLYSSDDSWTQGAEVNTATTGTDGTAAVANKNGLLPNGNYLLVETTAPEGYAVDNTPIRIVVDDEGVHVDAGMATDNISVETGIGSLVYSMKSFAADDHVDSTLHDVKAQPEVADNYSANAAWDKDEDAAEIHYQYNDEKNDSLEYVPTDADAASTYVADEGWSRLSVTQCMDENHGDTNDTKTPLGETSLSALFTGAVTVRTTNQAVDTLTVKKEVKNAPATDGEEEFEFTVSFRNANGAYDAQVYNADGSTDVTSFKLGNAGVAGATNTFTLKDGQYLTVSDLPTNASYTVTEKSYGDYVTSNTVNGATSADGLVATGQIGGDAAATVVFTNTYVTPVSLDADSALSVVKNLKGNDLSANEADPNNFDFTVTAVDTQGGATAAEAASKLGLAAGATSMTFQNGAAQMQDTNGDNIAETATATMSPIENGLSFSAADAGKTYTYEVEEIGTAENGYTFDTVTKHTVAYTVTLDGATLKVVASVDGTPVADNATPTVTFDNTYAPATVTTPADAAFSGTKTVTEEHGTFTLEADQFSFTMTSTGAPDGVTAPTPSNGFTVKNDAAGSFDFGTLTFSEPGVYTYTVTEETSTLPGITTSTEAYTITIKVVNDAGSLKIDSQTITNVANEQVNPDELDFTNVYNDGKVNCVITGTKVLESLASPAATLTQSQFTFVLLDEQGIEVARTTNSAPAAGSNEASFEFVLSYDAAGEHAYTVVELGADGNPGTGGTKDHITYSTTSYQVKVSVTGSAQDGDLVATATAAEDVTFTNTYNNPSNPGGGDPEKPTKPSDPSIPDIDVDKTLDGCDLVAGEFSFQVSAAKDYGTAVTPSSITATNAADGSVTFTDGFEFSKTGTYEFTVSEVLPTDDDPDTAGVQKDGVTYDDATYTVTATVSKGADGKLVVSWSGADRATFDNSYEPSEAASVTLGATKVLQGRDLVAGEFTFELRDAQGNVVSTATNAADGSVRFPALELTEEGAYTYTISEVAGSLSGVTYDTTSHTVTVTVTAGEDGALTAEVAYDGSSSLPVFTNTYVEPGQPETPDTPQDPSEPSQPGRPSKPTQPGGSNGSGGSEIPDAGDRTNTMLPLAAGIGGAILAAGSVLLKKRQPGR